MTDTGTYIATARKVVTLVRKLAQAKGIQPGQCVGPDYLLAALVRLFDAGGCPGVAASPTGELFDLAKAMHEPAPEELEELPPVKPDPRLARLLKNELAGFLEGRFPPDKALAILRSCQVAGTDRRASGAGGVPARIAPYEIIRRVTNCLQRGYRLGQLRYSPGKNGELSDFAEGRLDTDFANAVENYEEAWISSRLMLYGGPRRSKPAPLFETYMRVFGPVPADLMAVLLVNSVTPLSPCSSTLLVREAAWTLYPAFPHAALPALIPAVKVLRDAGKLRVFPEPDYCQLESRLLPSEEALVEFGQFMNDAEEDFAA